MIAEFRNTNFNCSPESVVPSGPGYTDVAYQTCAYQANRVGTTLINGDDYLATKYGFHSSHLWRNFGILCLFLVAYTLITCWLSEVMEWQPESAGPIQYKRSRKQPLKKGDNARDEENAPVGDDVSPPAYPGSVNDKLVGPLSGSKSSFTWDNLELHVQVGRETRKLLSGVSGYCKPGTMTALIGTSGAGKSTRMCPSCSIAVALLTLPSFDCPDSKAKLGSSQWHHVRRWTSRGSLVQPTNWLLPTNGHPR